MFIFYNPYNVSRLSIASTYHANRDKNKHFIRFIRHLPDRTGFNSKYILSINVYIK